MDTPQSVEAIADIRARLDAIERKIGIVVRSPRAARKPRAKKVDESQKSE